MLANPLELLRAGHANGWAVGGFNVYNLESDRAVIAAATNLIALGEVERARDLFEKLWGCANDLGLFSEETDADTGEMLGNFPQAFSHLGFINTAVQLHEAIAQGER